MTTIPVCPPTPTLNELLNSGNFIEVNVDELVQGEFAIRKDSEDDVTCVEVLENDNPVGYIRYRNYDEPRIGYVESLKRHLTQIGVLFYRRNPRKDFDNFAKKIGVRIRNYPEEQLLTTGEKVMENREIPNNIGQFLGPPTSGKGGRRKRVGTRRRTRKNKRKSTRRVRRK